MRRRIGAGLALTFLFWVAPCPAHADNNPCGKGDCSGNQGDCRSTEAPCSDDDLSPRFDNSPIVVCVQPDSCRFDGGKQQATLVPPNPTKIGEYIAGGFKVGSDFALALTNVIVTFVSSLGQFFA
jgi:hypothetical protein